MSFFGKSVGKLNNNHIMLMRFSKKNLEDWKAEKSSWDTIGKKTTRKDKIATRNRKIRENQKKKNRIFKRFQYN